MSIESDIRDGRLTQIDIKEVMNQAFMVGYYQHYTDSAMLKALGLDCHEEDNESERMTKAISVALKQFNKQLYPRGELPKPIQLPLYEPKAVTSMEMPKCEKTT